MRYTFKLTAPVTTVPLNRAQDFHLAKVRKLFYKPAAATGVFGVLTIYINGLAQAVDMTGGDVECFATYPYEGSTAMAYINDLSTCWDFDVTGCSGSKASMVQARIELREDQQPAAITTSNPMILELEFM